MHTRKSLSMLIIVPAAHLWTAHPTEVVAFHTTCVKWPVAGFQLGLFQSYLLASPDQVAKSEAASYPTLPMARFSPKRPSPECSNLHVAATEAACDAASSFHESAEAPYCARKSLCSCRRSRALISPAALALVGAGALALVGVGASGAGDDEEDASLVVAAALGEVVAAALDEEDEGTSLDDDDGASLEDEAVDEGASLDRKDGASLELEAEEEGASLDDEASDDDEPVGSAVPDVVEGAAVASDEGADEALVVCSADVELVVAAAPEPVLAGVTAVPEPDVVDASVGAAVVGGTAVVGTADEVCAAEGCAEVVLGLHFLLLLRGAWFACGATRRGARPCWCVGAAEVAVAPTAITTARRAAMRAIVVVW